MSIASMIATHGGDDVTLERATDTTADSGARMRTWATVGGVLNGWRQPTTADLRDEYGSRNMLVTHMVFFQADPAVQIDDRLVISGAIYAVRGDQNQAGMDRLWRVDVEEKRGA